MAEQPLFLLPWFWFKKCLNFARQKCFHIYQRKGSQLWHQKLTKYMYQRLLNESWILSVRNVCKLYAITCLYIFLSLLYQIHLQDVIMDGLHITGRVIECFETGDHGPLRRALVETLAVTWSELIMLTSNTFCPIWFAQRVGYVMVNLFYSVTKLVALPFYSYCRDNKA